MHVLQSVDVAAAVIFLIVRGMAQAAAPAHPTYYVAGRRRTTAPALLRTSLESVANPAAGLSDEWRPKPHPEADHGSQYGQFHTGAKSIQSHSRSHMGLLHAFGRIGNASKWFGGALNRVGHAAGGFFKGIGGAANSLAGIGDKVSNALSSPIGSALLAGAAGVASSIPGVGTAIAGGLMAAPSAIAGAASGIRIAGGIANSIGDKAMRIGGFGKKLEESGLKRTIMDVGGGILEGGFGAGGPLRPSGMGEAEAGAKRARTGYQSYLNVM